MRSKRNLSIIAKSIFKNSLTNGLVDEKKVKINLRYLSAKKPSGLVRILKIYKRLLQAALTKEEIIIETANKFQNPRLEKDLIKKTGAKKVVYKIDPGLIFGAKISHSDWVWDATLESKLKQLTTDI